MRTGAASGVATDCLARENAGVAAVFGGGVQARTQLEAVCCVRRIRHARVYDADAAAAERFAVEMTERLGLQVQRAADPAQALADAAVVCTATTSSRPVFQDHKSPAGGAHQRGRLLQTRRERDSLRDRLPRADRGRSPGIRAGRGRRFAAAARARTDSQGAGVRGIGRSPGGPRAGRRSADEITLFKSVGVAIQDLFAAARAAANARTLHLGIDLPR